MLTPDDVQGFMAARAIDGEILLLDVPTPTVEVTVEPTATPVPKGQIFRIYSSLPLSGAIQPHGNDSATRKSPEPAGWKACPTSGAVAPRSFSSWRCSPQRPGP